LWTKGPAHATQRGSIRAALLGGGGELLAAGSAARAPATRRADSSECHTAIATSEGG